MKIINLNESQYSRLFEDGGGNEVINFDNPIPQYNSQEEVAITSPISDPADPSSSKSKVNSIPPTAKKFAGMQSPQHFGAYYGKNA